MSDERSKELLSAYLDDALDERGTHELAAAWAADAELAAWGRRYLQVGSLMRADGSARHGLGLAVRVRSSLQDDGHFESSAAPEIGPAEAEHGGEAEANVTAISPTTATSPLAADAHTFDGTDPSRPADVVALFPGANGAAGTAAAADTAAGSGTPFGLRSLIRPVVGLAIAAGVAAVGVGVLRVWNEPAATVSSVAATVSTPLRWNVSQPGVEQRLNRYLVNHSEVTRNGTHGILSYARIVGYEPPSTARRERR